MKHLLVASVFSETISYEVTRVRLCLARVLRFFRNVLISASDKFLHDRILDHLGRVYIVTAFEVLSDVIKITGVEHI